MLAARTLLFLVASFTAIFLSSCATTSHNASSPTFEAGYYRLTTEWQGEGKSVDVVEYEDYDDGTLALADTGLVSGQAWKIEPIADTGFFRITNAYQGPAKSLGVVKDGKNNTVKLTDTNNVLEQYWKFTPLGNGHYRLTSKWLGDAQCLDVLNDGQNDKLWFTDSANKTTGQFWVVTLFSETNTAVVLGAQSAVGLIEMVEVAGGSFQMGSDDGEATEKPVHKVTLTGFSMGATEVTQAQYQAVMGTNPSKAKGKELPVEYVSWYDAVAFCNKLSLVEGLVPFYTIKDLMVTTNVFATGYRLPTEAQWEYAARGGAKSKGFTFAGSNDQDAVSWCYSNSGDKRLDDSDDNFDTFVSNHNQSHPVATKKPNELGLYDMSGNVAEWCQDEDCDYPAEAVVDPIGTCSDPFMSNRGGSYGTSAVEARISFRSGSIPDGRYRNLGFRVVRSQVTK